MPTADDVKNNLRDDELLKKVRGIIKDYSKSTTLIACTELSSMLKNEKNLNYIERIKKAIAFGDKNFRLNSPTFI